MSTEITIQQDQIDINVTNEIIVVESPTGGYPLPNNVYSVFGRIGNVVAQEGDYNLTQLGDVTISNPLTGQALVYNGTSWVNNTETYVGTVTSVNMSVPNGFTIGGNPITTAGTLALGFASGYSIPTTASQSNWDTAYSRSLTSAAVTGTTTKTLTLNEQGGGTITATWNDYDTAPVTSVFGRTGAITAQSGDYTTLLVPENTNLYFTDQRARYAISGDAASGVVYQNTTGIIALDDIPNTSLLHDSVTVNGSTVALGGSTSFTTSAVAEGTNLYFTTARAQAAITGTSPISVTSGVVSISQSNSTTDGYLSSTDWNAFNSKQAALTIGNLTSSDITVVGGTGAVVGTGTIMTLATVNSNVGTFGSSTAIPVVTVNGKGLVTAVTTDAVFIPSGALSFVGDVTGTGNTGSNTTLTLANVNSNVGSYGDSTNVPTFTVNAKGLITAASQTAIPTASTSTTGLLTSTDWNTFNGKQDQLNGTGFVKVSGTTVSYDNSTYLTTISGIAAGGELSGTYPNPSLVNSAVTGKLLTGVNITGGTIQATDSILTAFGKVQNQINGLIGGSIYKGTWDASTNTPTLTSGVGTTGWYYIVNVAGTTNLDGITDWNVGDWAIFDGTAWQQVDNTDAVVSVNGFTGAVNLTTSNISEGTNLYYTDARARNSVSGGTGISYNSSTGVITNSAPDQTVSLTASTAISVTGTYPNFTITNTAPDQVVSLTGAGTTSVSGTYPNFTITSNDQYVGTVTSVGITSTAAALTISSSPITSSGNIGVNFSGTSGQYVAGDGSLVAFPTLTGYVPYTGATATLDMGNFDVNARGIKVNGTAGSGHIDFKHQSGLPTGSASSSTLYANTNGDLAWLNDHSYTTTFVGSSNTADRTYTLPNASGTIALTTDISYPVTSVFGRTGAVTAQSGDYTTTQVTEGTNLYYTDARARGAINLTTTGNNGASTYNSTTGVLNVPTYTLAGLGGINLTSLSATSPLLYDNTTGVFSIQQANGTQAGYLSSADWTTFNSKQGAITLTTTGNSGASTLVSGTLNIPTYTLSGLGGVPTTRTITINGTTQDLSANQTWTIPTAVNATNTQDFTATAGQTTFTVTGGYTVGQLAVYYNGSKLAAAEYTATNGTTFVLATACQANDIVQAVVSVTGGGIGGSGTTNYLSKWTASGVLGNSLIYDNGSVLGVNTQSPKSWATISNNGQLYTSQNICLDIGQQFGFNTYYSSGERAISTGYAGALEFDQTNGNYYFKNSASSITADSTFTNSTKITFSRLGAATFASIVSSATEFRLNNNSFTRVATMDSGGGFGGGYNFNWNNGSPTHDSTGALAGYGYASDGSVRLYAEGSAAAGTSAPTKVLIASNGRAIFNSTTDRGYQLQVNGDSSSYACEIRQSNNTATYDLLTLTHEATSGNRRMVVFNTGGYGTVGTIISTNSSTTYNTSSDYRLKQDLKDYNGLDLISKIKTYDFEWKSDNSRMYGVLAHELADVLSYAVYGEKDGIDENGKPIMQGVDYSKIVPILIRAIQQQQEQINQLINK